MLPDADVNETGIDAAAVKPSECDVASVRDLPLGRVTVDYEGREHVPDPGTLRELAADLEVRVTAPVRADGFDPLGDDERLAALPDSVGVVLVAGHPAYLSETEVERPIAPRLGAGIERAPDAWVGTEGIERIALATGATQFLLYSPTVERELRGLRAAGFGGDLAVYAPTVLADDPDALLDSLGGYAARREPVRRALPEGAPTDADAEGEARRILLEAIPDYALTGTPRTVREKVAALREAGADHVVGYPARGLEAFQ